MKNNFAASCIWAYIKFRFKIFLLLLFFAGIFLLVFFLYHIPIECVVYALLLCIVFGLVAMIADFSRFYNTHRTLSCVSSTICSTLDGLPTPKGQIEKDYGILIKNLYDNQSRILAEASASKLHMTDYYAMWVHQIKVPIQALRLLMSDEEKNSQQGIELFKIEQYVEMALSYVRLESDYTDYVLKHCDLDDIVKQAVRKYAPLFIAKKISLDIKATEMSVLTDEKWILFVIEQILSNSLKYTKSGSISIYKEAPGILAIEDTGIGIAPEDIKRVTQKGFTGQNGRIDKRSTGLGLYLCSEILTRLSHTIKIESEIGMGTKVSINFKTRTILGE